MWDMKARVIQHPTLSSSLKEVQERLLGLLVEARSPELWTQNPPGLAFVGFRRALRLRKDVLCRRFLGDTLTPHFDVDGLTYSRYRQLRNIVFVEVGMFRVSECVPSRGRQLRVEDFHKLALHSR
jgi:hypothetical protein